MKKLLLLTTLTIVFLGSLSLAHAMKTKPNQVDTDTTIFDTEDGKLTRKVKSINDKYGERIGNIPCPCIFDSDRFAAGSTLKHDGYKWSCRTMDADGYCRDIKRESFDDVKTE